MSVTSLHTSTGVPRSTLWTRASANAIGASGAALFAWVSVEHFVHTRSFVGVLFVIEQTWIVGAYVARRRATALSVRGTDWAVAFVGTFAGVLFRPDGAHPHASVEWGLALQLVGLTWCLWSLWTLGRSFGFAAADRGLVRRGPYAVVRHPIYASYVALQLGYVLQSLSLANVLVMMVATSANIARIVAEERVLNHEGQYTPYRATVPWRLLPGVW